MKKKPKIHKDKNGREYIKESYFVGGKMKFRRVYVIDGIIAEDFYEQNASDIDHYVNGEYWKISYEKDSTKYRTESNRQKFDLSDNKSEDLLF